MNKEVLLIILQLNLGLIVWLASKSWLWAMVALSAGAFLIQLFVTVKETP